MQLKELLLMILFAPLGMALVVGAMALCLHLGWAHNEMQAWFGACALFGVAGLLGFVAIDTYYTFRSPEEDHHAT